jgi:small nuclear ribonucleoprotein B and B'
MVSIPQNYPQCYQYTNQIHLQPPPKSKGGKMLGLINWRIKVTVNDGRAFVGQMLAFDRHMNLVLAECEEFRRVRPKKKPGEAEAGPVQEMKRTLGLVILRGETVVSLSVEGPPPAGDDDKKNMVRSVGRRSCYSAR